MLNGGPVDVLFKPEVGVTVGWLVIDALVEGVITPELPKEFIETKLLERL